MIRNAKLPRCQHRDPSNRRCRKLVSNRYSRFCIRHAADVDAEPDLSAALAGGLRQFTSPAPINEFLSRLLLLLSENRISPRRAAVLAYITNQILRTVSAMETAAAEARERRPVKVIWDLPCPPHEPREPEPAHPSPAVGVPTGS